MKECSVCHQCFDDQLTRCPNDDKTLTLSIPGSTVIGARYILEKRLGKGGMGIVFKATHQFLKNAYAVKIILPNLVEDDRSLLTRFRQEAVLAASIHHPNVIRVTDFGVEHETMPYLVMEYVDGVPLSHILKLKSSFSPAETYEYFLPIALGVGEAHHKGIVHRDLKPQNVLVQHNLPLREAVKVFDFGLAKIKSTDMLGSFIQAQTMSILGSPPYMAPEQWESKDVDHRADIYALGVMLYQMLAGDLPFKGDSIPQMMYQHLFTEVPAFASHGIYLPPAIEAVVRRALRREKDERYDSVQEMLRDFEHALKAGDSPATVRLDAAGATDGSGLGARNAQTENNYQAPATVTDPASAQTQADLLSDSKKERLKTYLNLPSQNNLMADPKLAQEFLDAKQRAEKAEERAAEAEKLLSELAEAQRAAEEAQRKALAAKQQVEEDVRRRLEVEMEQKLALEQKTWQESEARRLAKEAEARREAENRANYLAQTALEAQAAAEAERKKAEQAAQLRQYEESVRRQAEIAAAQLAAQIEQEKIKYREARRQAELEAALREEAENKRRKIETDLQLIAEKEAALRQTAEAEAQKRIRQQAAEYEKEAVAAQQRIEAARQLAELEAHKREEAESAKRAAEEQARLLAQQIGEVQRRIEEIQMQVSQKSDSVGSPTAAGQSFGSSGYDSGSGGGINPAESVETKFSLRGHLLEKSLQNAASGAMRIDIGESTNPQRENTSPNLFDTQSKTTEQKKSSWKVAAAAAAAAVLLFAAAGGGIALYYLLPNAGGEASSNSNELNSRRTTNENRALTDRDVVEPSGLPGNRRQEKMVRIEGGAFQMGSSEGDPLDGLYGTQYPAHLVRVEPFFLDKTEVAKEEYDRFLKEKNYAPPTNWKDGKFPAGEEKFPVTYVSQTDAKEFAKWISEREKMSCRLPTEDEWEFAARNGSQQTVFPWGNDWKADAANLTTGRLAAVGATAGDATLAGDLRDMLGNVSEWTGSPMKEYPNHPKRLTDEFKRDFVIRGSFAGETQDLSKFAKWILTRRRSYPPEYKAPFVGFRLACEP